MDIQKANGAYEISNIGAFDCDVVFDCGQAFRWEKIEGYWQGISLTHIAKVKSIDNGIKIICEEGDINYWVKYLDLKYDYISAKSQLKKDKDIAPMVKLLPGMRFLNQDFYECLISFIISANNNVKRIKGIIEKLSLRYGKCLGNVYAFPEAKVLAKCTIDEIKECGAGYRAHYIIESAKLVAGGYDYAPLYTRDLYDARKELTIFKGVGIKVADCVLLFSLGRKDAFPVDTWIRKVMHDILGDTSLSDNQIRAIAADRFMGNAGLANQYLFHINRVGYEDTI